MNNKKNKLVEQVSSVLYSAHHREEIDNILCKLKLNHESIVEAFLHYTFEQMSHEGNEVYSSVPNRVILHVYNLIQECWHIRRQALVSQLMSELLPKTIADIGFGVPSRYVKELAIEEKKSKITLLDKYDSAFIFSRELLNHWDPSWENNISFQQTDMDTKEYVGDFDVYLIQDAIEHTVDPSGYLKKLVEQSPESSKFIISLPIGPLFPRHYMAWESDDDGICWLNQHGLSVDHYQNVYVNPDVDIFAQDLAFDYHDLYALCSKKK